MSAADVRRPLHVLYRRHVQHERLRFRRYLYPGQDAQGYQLCEYAGRPFDMC